MNMISCGERCKHQKNGYCVLDGRAKITNSVSSACRYYEQAENSTGGSTDDKGGKADESI